MTSTFFPPHNIGGADLHVKNLADELDRLGHEVHVLYSMDAYRAKKVAYGSSPEQAEGKAEQDGIHTHVIETPLNSSYYLTYVLGGFSPTTKKFERLVNEIKPDVVHHHEMSLLGYPILKKLGDYLNLYTAHDYWLICQHGVLPRDETQICQKKRCFHCALSFNRPPQFWRHTNSFRKRISELDFLIAPSDYLKRRVLKELGPRRVVTIPNFVPLKETSATSGAGACFSDFFLYAGRLERYKGILELVDLFKGIDCRLVVVGKGPLKNEVNAFLKANKLDEKIAFLGYVDRSTLYWLLMHAEALIMPSMWPENCPLIALESLSVGTPVIGSKCGGLPEIVERVDKSLAYDHMTELKQILLNYDKTKYSPYAKRVYNDYYSPGAFMKKYLDLIDGSVVFERLQ
jgi:glycosyltransferase involved in cell wall biosynthesis